MIKKIFCISGKAGSGKDTSALYMKSMIEQEGGKVLIIHFADLLKYICSSYFGWNGEKDEYGRSLLQHIGTEVVREKDPHFWVSFVADFIFIFSEKWDYVIIPDCRFPNEVCESSYKGDIPVYHIRVVRHNYSNCLTAEQQQHPSETALDGVIPFAILDNKGTLEDLHREVWALLKGMCII